jgi:tRNA threonylcarbamoyladenosine biosynthesis protein TsaE
MEKSDFILKHAANEQSLLQLGKRLAKACVAPPIIIYLYGNLGAGKTTLARGFIRGMGYKEKVSSPSYALVEPYELDGKVVLHFDFYRVNKPKELEHMGIQDYFFDSTICLIEWPEKGEGFLPPPDLACYVEMHPIGRNLKIVAHTERGREILKRFKHVKKAS